MNKQTALILAAAGCLTGALGTSAFAQSGDKTDKMSDAKMSSGKMSSGKMSGKKMTHQQMMDKMNSMSSSDKALMFDKMPMEQQMSVMEKNSMMMDGKKMDKMDKMSK